MAFITSPLVGKTDFWKSDGNSSMIFNFVRNILDCAHVISFKKTVKLTDRCHQHELGVTFLERFVYTLWRFSLLAPTIGLKVKGFSIIFQNTLHLLVHLFYFFMEMYSNGIFKIIKIKNWKIFLNLHEIKTKTSFIIIYPQFFVFESLKHCLNAFQMNI